MHRRPLAPAGLPRGSWLSLLWLCVCVRVCDAVVGQAEGSSKQSLPEFEYKDCSLWLGLATNEGIGDDDEPYLRVRYIVPVRPQPPGEQVLYQFVDTEEELGPSSVISWAAKVCFNSQRSRAP